jgi:stage II sporulation protein D
LKKLLPFLAFIMMLISVPSLSKADEPTIYPNVVNVSVYKATSLTLTLTNAYQLSNNDTGLATPIPANSVVTIKNNGTAIEISFTGVTQTSTTGFKVQELPNILPSIAALSNGISYRGSFSFVKNGSYVGVTNYLDMEDYLKGVVPSEMPASWPKEALKAQAIAARSYAETSMGLTSTPSSQVYRGYTGEDSRSNVAIKETEGLMAEFAGKPIMAFFFSTSGGQTANYGDVWNGAYAKPYYVSVADPFEVSPNSTWTETFSASTLLKSFGFTDTTTKLLDASLKATGANGEVSGVTVKTSAGDKTITGDEGVIRKLFPTTKASHYYEIDSNWFTMTVSKAAAPTDLSVQTTTGTEAVTVLNGQTVQTASGVVTLDGSDVSIQTSSGLVSSSGTPGTGEVTSVTLNGKGWGHRIGMSQYGAKGYAEQGWTAAQIIQHYFQGTTVSR